MSTIRISTPFPPELNNWLKDAYPAWLELQPDDFRRLVPFNSPDSTLSLNYADTVEEIGSSTIFGHLRVFLELITEGKIVLYSDSTMSSDTLEILIEVLIWPNVDFTNVKKMQRPLYEENICPLDFLRALAMSSGLIKVDGASITVTEAGRWFLENSPDAHIIREVFDAAFSKVNPRTLTKLAHPWVQEETGIVFWGLSRVAGEPRSADQLTRYCFVPPKEFLDDRLSTLPIYMRAVFLNPLIWFGLIETQKVMGDDENPSGILYQKTPLFDKFMHFDVTLVQPIERLN